MRTARLAVVLLAVLAPAASAQALTTYSPQSLTFVGQAPGTISAAQSVRVAYQHDWSSAYIEYSVHGANPEDFFVFRRDCDADGSYAGTCFDLRVRFAPGADGVRTASIRIHNYQDGTIVQVPLTGITMYPEPVVPVQGAKGDQGQPGAAGPRGPLGPRGREAKVTCRVKRVKGTRRMRVTCTTRRTTAARVRLARRGRVIKSVVRRSRAGRVTASFTVPRGSYVVSMGDDVARVRG
jgi:hypothetical protein